MCACFEAICCITRLHNSLHAAYRDTLQLICFSLRQLEPAAQHRHVPTRMAAIFVLGPTVPRYVVLDTHGNRCCLGMPITQNQSVLVQHQVAESIWCLGCNMYVDGEEPWREHRHGKTHREHLLIQTQGTIEHATPVSSTFVVTYHSATQS